MTTMREVVEAIDRSTAGRRVLVATGVGSHQSIVARHFTWDYPDRMLLTSCGHGAMGSGLPYLIGAWLTDPTYLPILITGDGSFAIEVPGLATVYEHGIPAKVFVLDNKSFGIVRQYEELNDIKPVATIRPPVLWPDVAWGYGVEGWNLRDFEDDLQRAVDHMFLDSDPRMLHISVHDYGVWPILEAHRGPADMSWPA